MGAPKHEVPASTRAKYLAGTCLCGAGIGRAEGDHDDSDARCALNRDKPRTKVTWRERGLVWSELFLSAVEAASFVEALNGDDARVISVTVLAPGEWVAP